MIVSPFLYDWIAAYYGGASPYLARKRAELNERRREAARAAASEASGSSFNGIARSVRSRKE